MATDVLRDGASEPNWKDLALWLMDCQAATAEYARLTKSVSRAEKKRHTDICRAIVTFFEAGYLPSRVRAAGVVLARVNNSTQEREDLRVPREARYL